MLSTSYIRHWEESRRDEIARLTSEGKIPVPHDVEERQRRGEELSATERAEIWPLFMGVNAGAISEVLPARAIVEEMVEGAAAILRGRSQLASRL